MDQPPTPGAAPPGEPGRAPDEPADAPDTAPTEASYDAAPGPAPEDDTRRYPSTIGGACYLAVLVIFAVGLVLASVGTWRTGIRVSASSLMLASVLRLALPRRDAGMLAVRHRVVDALVLAGSAAALLFLAATIPDQPM